jgi:DDE superfamily endonuclease
VAEACRSPKEVGIPITQWSASKLGEHVRRMGLAFSDRSVGRVLEQALLQPHRQRMWLTSHDEDFRAKRDDVLHVYYDAPSGEHIVCLDEKTGMQALERVHADIPMRPGEPLRREPTYVRHGTLCLMGAYDVRQRKLFGFVAEGHNSETFVDLLDVVDQCYPEGKGHLICDNLSAHMTEDVLGLARRSPPLGAALHAQARVLAQPDRVRVLDPAEGRTRARLLRLTRRAAVGRLRLPRVVQRA